MGMHGTRSQKKKTSVNNPEMNAEAIAAILARNSKTQGAAITQLHTSESKPVSKYKSS